MLVALRSSNSTRASLRIAISLRPEISSSTMTLLLRARLASGSAASCSSPIPKTLPAPNRLALPLRSTSSSTSRILPFAASSLPSPSAFQSSLLLMRPLSSSGSYITKSPGVRTRLAAGAATRGKTDADSSASSTSDASQPSPPPPQPAVPRRTVEQIVKRITRADVALQFARSGGAGGQNVNKVNTKADLRLNLDATDWLEPELVEAVKRAEKKRINKEGELVVTSTNSRSQAANVDDALAKLQAILDTAAKTLIPPEVDPEKAKQIEKALKAGNEVRLDLKKKKADKKKERRAPIDW